LEGKKVQDKSKSNFDAYVQLQSESYEFITRTVAVHNWLREAYRLLCEKPDLSAEEMCEAWEPAFERIYGHLFATFLRPYRVMIFPLGEFLRAQADSFGPGTLATTHLDTLRLWEEGQSRFLRGVADTLQQVGGKSDKTASGNENGAIDGLQELTPLRLIGDIADQEGKAYLQTLEQLVGYFSESQFPLPKNLVLHLKQLVSSYPKAYHLAQRHEGMFRSTWEKSLKRFTLEIKRTAARPVPEFKEFYNAYTSIFTEEYDQLLGSPEFIEVQNSFMATNLDVIASMKKVMEAQMEMFPALPFVTGGEMAALEKTVHSHKRRIDRLERRVREMERDSVAVPARVEVETLTRNVQRNLGNTDSLLQAVN
jgi:hypothetical protein